MTDPQLGPLAALPFWFVPIAPIGDDVLTGSVCLASSQPESEIHHLDGRIEQVPEPFNSAAGVLVFETAEDASAYFLAYAADPEGSAAVLGHRDAFSVARMSGQQVLDNFKQVSPGSLWHVPTPVHHDWAEEVIDALTQRGIGPSTKVATKRLLDHLTRQN